MIQFPERKSPLTDDVYKSLVNIHECAKTELENARRKEYVAWKKILEYENEHFQTNHPV